MSRLLIIRFTVILLTLVFSSCHRKEHNGEKKEETIETIVEEPQIEEAVDVIKEVEEDLSVGELPYYWCDDSKYAQGDSIVISELSLKIDMLPADNVIPHLTTYLSGKKVDEETICIGCCGFDCGFECSESTVITEDLNIISMFCSIYPDCSDSSKPTEAREIRRVGHIEPNGNIVYGKEDLEEYESDSAQKQVMGFDAHQFDLESEFFKQRVYVKFLSNDTIHYLVYFENTESGIASRYSGLAVFDPYNPPLVLKDSLGNIDTFYQYILESRSEFEAILLSPEPFNTLILASIGEYEPYDGMPIYDEEMYNRAWMR